MVDQVDLAIIGGGAAGLTAAIFAAQTASAGRRIVILDSAAKLGAKILVSGGGRCNVTHDQIHLEDFNGSKNIVRNILAAFDKEATVRWFASLGIELKTEEGGKLFPVANSARAVLSALLNRCEQLHIELRTDCRVNLIQHSGDRFAIEHKQGMLESRQVILATGGRSLPRSGSDGSGWQLAKNLGHSVTPTYAALVPLLLDARMFHAQVSGISQEVELTTLVEGKRIDQRRGQLLWTHFGISGPVVMDASRHWVIANETGRKPQMLCNLLPGETFESVERWLIELAGTRAKLSIGNAIGQRLPERVAEALVKHVGMDPAMQCGQVSRDLRRNLVHALTALPLPVVGHRGWNYAEVTAGGVPLNEIDYRSMQSRKVPGLYLAGEILDCDGRIGGFNFQWAWSTGYLAGTTAVS